MFERTTFAPPPTKNVTDRKARDIALSVEMSKLALNEAIALPDGTSMLCSYANIFFAPRVFKERTHEGKKWCVRTA